MMSGFLSLIQVEIVWAGAVHKFLNLRKQTKEG